jgi:hypothetical protein
MSDPYKLSDDEYEMMLACALQCNRYEHSHPTDIRDRFEAGWRAARAYRPEPRDPISPEQHKAIEDFCAEVPGRTVTHLGYTVSTFGECTDITAEGWLSDGTQFEVTEALKITSRQVAGPRHEARYTA